MPTAQRTSISRSDAAEALTGQARQDAFAKLFAEEPQKIMQFAYIAHMRGILGKSPARRLHPQLRNR